MLTVYSGIFFTIVNIIQNVIFLNVNYEFPTALECLNDHCRIYYLDTPEFKYIVLISLYMYHFIAVYCLNENFKL